MTTLPRSLAHTSLHLAVLTVAALIVVLTLRTHATGLPDLASRADHAAVCRTCSSCRPGAAEARDAYLVRSGCIEDPRRPE